MQKPKSVEAYLESLPEERRSALQKLRETIVAAAGPEAPKEGITYEHPGFLLDGHGFGLATPDVRRPLQLLPEGTAREGDRRASARTARASSVDAVTGGRRRGPIRYPVDDGRPLPTALVKKVDPDAPRRGDRQAGRAD